MSKELPYFKFYPSEWLNGDISDETDSIQATFIRVCALYWHKNGALTMAKLERKVHKTKVKGLLNAGYISEKDGCVSINFLDEQMAEFIDLKEKRSKAGKKGGQASVKQKRSKRQPKVNHLEVDKEIDIEVDKIKSKSVPPLDEFLDYLKPVCSENGLDYEGLLFSIKAKYDSWVEAGWKDGHGKSIKNWKTKIRSVLPYLKTIQNGTANQPDWFVRATGN